MERQVPRLSRRRLCAMGSKAILQSSDPARFLNPPIYRGRMHMHVEHVGLAARDPRFLKAWYERCLNARQVRVLSESPPAFLVELPGGLLLEIYEADAVLRETRDNKLAGWRHLALRVESLESAKRELEHRGVPFRHRPGGAGASPIQQPRRRRGAARSSQYPAKASSTLMTAVASSGRVS